MSAPLSLKAVLFADLRGSTGLYESLGNAHATLVITRCVAALAAAVGPSGGRLIKTLGDGLMAAFDDPDGAARAAAEMHACIERTPAPRPQMSGDPFSRSLQLRVAMALGEVAEVQGDIFGDAVNVAARLLEHAADGETLITDQLYEALDDGLGEPFRYLDWVHLRGRAEPVLVMLQGGVRGDSGPVTQFVSLRPHGEPCSLRLHWQGKSRALQTDELPAVIGRSRQSILPIDDRRVSRLHARLDWHGSSFHLTDLSTNGTTLQLSGHSAVHLRRTTCSLHGHGEIGLSGSPGAPGVLTLRFEVLNGPNTQPSTPHSDTGG
ncbi:MAG: FHA domain-containing protein [Burkholderiaceae bacterium]